MRVLRHLVTFEPERTGALHAYLRKAVLHRILDEVRHVRRGPVGVELDDNLPSALPSPYELAAEQEDRDIFEACARRVTRRGPRAHHRSCRMGPRLRRARGRTGKADAERRPGRRAAGGLEARGSHGSEAARRSA